MISIACYCNHARGYQTPRADSSLEALEFPFCLRSVLYFDNDTAGTVLLRSSGDHKVDYHEVTRNENC